ncbi:MAG: lysophospholipid acyltransferase family protein [Candidatus Saccharibacteria bacterium]
MYFLVRLIARLVFWVLRIRYKGTEKFPSEGAVIITSNHINFWDPVLVGAFLKRQVHFMAKAELFDNKLLGWFLRSLNAIPVKRGSPDRKALRKAIEVLENEGVLGIFPEGTRSQTGELAKAYHGAAMLAVKGKAQVIPVGCINTPQAFSFGGWRDSVIIKYGDAVTYNDEYGNKTNNAALEEISQDIMNRISVLLVD